MRGCTPVLLALALSTLLAALLSLQFGALPGHLLQPLWSRALFARDGGLLDVQIASDQQWRLPLPQTQLPQRYEAALLAFEDRRFYTHPGIDPVAVGRAALANLRAVSIRQGGSTISMQLARLLGGNAPRNWANKLGEAWLTLRLEWRLDKPEILRLYATHAPFGGNIVGLHAASWRYFGRPPTELSWAEAALLAVLPNSPGLLHPGRNRDALVAKRNRLLAYLYGKHLLEQRDYALALAEPLPAQPLAWPAAAPHLLQRLIDRYPDQTLFNTTIDTRVQHDLRDMLARQGQQLAQEGVRNLALIVIDHQALQTIAYIGNATADPASGAFVDIAASPRSTGSILKPLLYGLMLQEGALLPSTLVADVPSSFKGYAPQNFDQDYRGAVPARQALSQSLNVPAVRMLRSYGVARFRERLQAFGLSSVNRSAEDYGLSLILGGAEASLWELTQTYANLVHIAGNPLQPALRRNVALLSTSGRDRDAPAFPLRAGAAWLSLQAMINVVRPELDVFWRDYEDSQVIAWKTGTSFGLRDGWAIGSNGRYTVGVWSGNADGSSATTLGGARSAGPVLLQAFAKLGNSGWIERPVLALKTVQVCADDGFIAADGCAVSTVSAPADSHFSTPTPYHKRVFLSADARHRVHSGCEQPSGMRAEDWFLLPPAQEYFWRRNHANYRRLPAWRADCIASLRQFTAEQPFELLYPAVDSDLFLPLEMSGTQGSAVFRAVHRDALATLHWHLDGRYLGASTLFHERSIQAPPGAHTLVLVDQTGVRMERDFTVISPGFADLDRPSRKQVQ